MEISFRSEISCNLRPKGLGGTDFVLGEPGVGVGTTVAVKTEKDRVPEECSARARVAEIEVTDWGHVRVLL